MAGVAFTAILFFAVIETFVIDALHFEAGFAVGTNDILAGIDGDAFINGRITSEIIGAWFSWRAISGGHACVFNAFVIVFEVSGCAGIAWVFRSDA